MTGQEAYTAVIQDLGGISQIQVFPHAPCGVSFLGGRSLLASVDQLPILCLKQQVIVIISVGF